MLKYLIPYFSTFPERIEVRGWMTRCPMPQCPHSLPNLSPTTQQMHKLQSFFSQVESGTVTSGDSSFHYSAFITQNLAEMKES